MRTNERLERAGWRFLTRSGNVDFYQRQRIIILYDNEKDEATGYFDPHKPRTIPTYHSMSDVQLDLFCERLDNQLDLF